MTDHEAARQHQRYPHISLETIAYYAGRNGLKCEFVQKTLVAAFDKGRSDVRAEDRLDADTEWNAD